MMNYFFLCTPFQVVAEHREGMAIYNIPTEYKVIHTNMLFI